jgi:hypothetical protein
MQMGGILLLRAQFLYHSNNFVFDGSNGAIIDNSVGCQLWHFLFKEVPIHKFIFLLLINTKFLQYSLLLFKRQYA